MTMDVRTTEENMTADKDALLRVEDLRTSFFTPVGEVKAVGGLSFELRRGEVLRIIDLKKEARPSRLVTEAAERSFSRVSCLPWL